MDNFKISNIIDFFGREEFNQIKEKTKEWHEIQNRISLLTLESLFSFTQDFIETDYLIDNSLI